MAIREFLRVTTVGLAGLALFVGTAVGTAQALLRWGGVSCGRQAHRRPRRVDALLPSLGLIAGWYLYFVALQRLSR